MNPLLQQAFERASELSEEAQDRFARFLLAELESERQWAELFARLESEDLLEHLAGEAVWNTAPGWLGLSPEKTCERGDEYGVHHRRRTPYSSKSVSLDTRTRSRTWAWAMSIRSKGSRCGPGRAPARTASATVIDSSAKPWEAITLAVRPRNADRA